MLRSAICRMGITIIFISVVFSSLVNAVLITYGSCKSPMGKDGYCMLLTHCPHLIELVHNYSSYVKESYCGPFRNNISDKNLFCCVDIPEQNHTVPEATTASTVAGTTASGKELPEPGECGISLENRIYGGIETSLGEYPWTALIKYKRPYNAVALSCAGALINSRYVLSAAHCARSSIIPLSWEMQSVRLGEWNINTNPDCVGDYHERLCAPPYEEIDIERVIIHRSYLPDSNSEFDDIALLRLVRSVAYSTYIRPICLPRWQELQNKSYIGAIADVAGWGQTEIHAYSAKKRKISVKIWDTDECEKKFASVQVPVNRTLQLCAGGLPMVDTCRGDSGAPLIIQERLNNKKGGYFIIGVVSFGMSPCGMEGWPGIYTRITNYIDWIVNNLEN